MRHEMAFVLVACLAIFFLPGLALAGNCGLGFSGGHCDQNFVAAPVHHQQFFAQPQLLVVPFAQPVVHAQAFAAPVNHGHRVQRVQVRQAVQRQRQPILQLNVGNREVVRERTVIRRF